MIKKLYEYYKYTNKGGVKPQLKKVYISIHILEIQIAISQSSYNTKTEPIG